MLCVKGFWYFEIKLPTTQVYADTFYGSKTMLFKTALYTLKDRPSLVNIFRFNIENKEINKHETKTVNN